jgi:hypothetical protein
VVETLMLSMTALLLAHLLLPLSWCCYCYYYLMLLVLLALALLLVSSLMLQLVVAFVIAARVVAPAVDTAE